MDKMVVDGIELFVSRKKMKNMYLRVKAPDGRVCVSVPSHMKDFMIEDFIKSKMSWIQSQQEKVKEHAYVECQFEDGELHYLWGKAYRLKVIHVGACHDVYIQGENLILNTRETSSVEDRGKQLDKWYRGHLSRELPRVLNLCEEIVGKKASECRIKKMKTRWGTCNTIEKRIWMNLELAKKPPECLHYVMIHELTHLYERGHGPRFKAYMDEFCPDWRRIKKRLNEGSI